MSVEVLKASWLVELGQFWVVGRLFPTTTVWLIHILCELRCTLWEVSLAWGTCSDMGAGDWFAANGGKGQAALHSLLLFSQSHSCILFSTAIACFIITVGGGNSGELQLGNSCLFPLWACSFDLLYLFYIIIWFYLFSVSNCLNSVSVYFVKEK